MCQYKYTCKYTHVLYVVGMYVCDAVTCKYVLRREGMRADTTELSKRKTPQRRRDPEPAGFPTWGRVLGASPQGALRPLARPLAVPQRQIRVRVPWTSKASSGVNSVCMYMSRFSVVLCAPFGIGTGNRCHSWWHLGRLPALRGAAMPIAPHSCARST